MIYLKISIIMKFTACYIKDIRGWIFNKTDSREKEKKNKLNWNREMKITPYIILF